MIDLPWQMKVFIVQTIAIMPFYIFVLSGIFFSRHRKRANFQSPYYTLVLSQGLADTFAVTVFFTLVLGRYFEIGNHLIYSLRDYGSPIFYSNSGPFSFTIRIVGVFYITLQRYLTVCKPQGSLNYFVNHTPPYKLILGHWLTAILIYSPAFIVSDATFENEQTLFVLTSARHAQVFSVIVGSCFLVIGTSVAVMYGMISISLFRSRYINNTTRKSSRAQDVRISIHVLSLIIFSMIVFCYYIGEFMLNRDTDRTALRAFRLYYPTVSGNFSFINPISLLLSNSEVQKMFINLSKKSSVISIGDERTSVVTTSKRSLNTTLVK